MSAHKINFARFSGGAVAVPQEFISLLPVCFEDTIKVYLLCLARGEVLSAKAIAKELEIPPERAEKAIAFLCEASLFLGESQPKEKDLPRPSPHQITPNEINEFAKVLGSRELLDKIEKTIGSSMSSAYTRTITYIIETQILPRDVLLLVVEYCAKASSSGVPSASYILKVAESFSEEGITTAAAAKKHISEILAAGKLESKIKSAFGLSTALTKNQKEFISKWTGELGFSLDMIEKAYEICLDNTGKLSFPYIHKVLESFAEEGAKKPEDIKKLPPRVGKTRGKTNSGGFDFYTAGKIKPKISEEKP